MMSTTTNAGKLLDALKLLNEKALEPTGYVAVKIPQFEMVSLRVKKDFDNISRWHTLEEFLIDHQKPIEDGPGNIVYGSVFQVMESMSRQSCDGIPTFSWARDIWNAIKPFAGAKSVEELILRLEVA